MTRILGYGLPLAWAAPVLAHLAGQDWLLLPVIVLGTASLLRVGRTLADRLVIAVLALAGVLAVAGLLFSVWPWGLAPVPIAGLALSTLATIAALTGRRPCFRLPVTGADLTVAGSALVAGLVTGLPLLRADFTGRLALVLQGEDLSRHFAIFDLQTRVQSYLFLRPAADASLEPGLVGYPQASHLVAATLDRFVRGGAAPGSAAESFDSYLAWTVLTFVVFVASLVWAAGWVAGERLRGWHAAPLLIAVAAAAVFGPLFTLWIRGYPSEMAGLALFAVAIALLARPPSGESSLEQLVVLAALAVGVAYTYYFLAPVLAVAAGWWAVEHRRTLPWRTVAAVGVVALTACLPPLLVNRASAVGEQLLLGGPVVATDRGLLLALLAVLAAAAVAGGLWREPVWRTLGVALGAAAGFAAALHFYQRALGGQSYYVEKALHLVLVLSLIGLAAVGVLLARLRLRRRAGVAVVVLASLGVLAALRVIDPSPTQVHPRAHLPTPYATESWGRAYLEGALTMTPEADAVVTQLRGAGPTRMVVFWGAFNRGADFYAAQYAAALQRRFTGPAYRVMLLIPQPRSEARLVEALDLIGDTPAVLVTREPAVAEAVRRHTALHPGADVRVVLLDPFPEDSIDPVPPAPSIEQP